MKNKLIPLVAFGLVLAPFAFAVNTVGGIIITIGGLLNTVVPILITLAVIYFIWGVVSYVLAKEEEAKTAGRDKMIYGLIGLVVIVGMWGLVGIIANTFGIGVGGGSQGITAPCIPGTIGC